MKRTLILTSPLMKGSDVKAAQTKLIKAGFLRKGGNDGVWGPESGRASSEGHWLLGFPSALAHAEAYGETMDNVLDQWIKTKTLPEDYQKRRNIRLKQISIGKKALEWLRNHIGDTERPPGSNLVSWASVWYGVKGPWCAMGATRALVEAGSKAFKRGSRYSYVPYIVQDAIAGRNGLMRTFAPESGDLWCVDWTGNGDFDHVEMVDDPPDSINPGTPFTTIGCNTSFDDSGDQSNGGACAARHRTILGGGRSVFVRVLY